MEDDILARLEQLSMYIPFIDYLLTRDENTYTKFKDIRRWIIEKKRYPIPSLEKMEQSLTRAYKNLFLGDEKIPSHIMDIFNNADRGIKFFNVNLCSDDSGSEPEIVELSIKEDTANAFKPNAKAKAPTASTRAVSNASRNSSSSGVGNSIASSPIRLTQSDDEIEIISVSLPEPKWKPKIKVKITDNRRKMQSKNSLHIPSDDDGKDDEIVEICDEDSDRCRDEAQPSNNDKSIEEIDMPEIEHIAENPVEEKLFMRRKDFLPPIEDDAGHIQQSETEEANTILEPEPGMNNPLESMGVAELDQIYQNLVKQTGLDLTNYLQYLYSTFVATSIPPDVETDKEEVSVTVNQVPPVSFNSLPSPNVQHLTYAAYPQPFHNLHNGFYQPPPRPLMPHNKPLNLNDPRILKQLRSIQESPHAPNEARKTAANLSNCLSVPQSCTYGEYRRKRAAQEREDQRRKEEELRLVAERKKKAEMESMEMRAKIENQKQTDYIRSILMPHNEEIENAIENEKTATEKGASNAKTSEENNADSQRLNKVNKALKELECTVIGYSEMSDFVPKTIAGKRRSSISARTAIAEQLSGLGNSEDSSDERLQCQTQTNTKNNATQQQPSLATPKSIASKRRSSLSARTAIFLQLVESDVEYSDERLQCQTQRNTKINTLQQQPSNVTPKPVTARRKSVAKNRSTVAEKRRKLIDENTEIPSEKQPRIDTVRVDIYSQAYSQISAYQSSSSDTDTFDFDKFQWEKTKSHILKNQPKVVLQRLTADDIAEYVRLSRTCKAETTNTLTVELVENRSKCLSTLKARQPTEIGVAKPITIKRFNVDSHMVESNTRFCMLCKSKPIDLTNHYIRNHKTESYVARLTRSQLDALALEPPLVKEMGSGGGPRAKYKVRCPFCNDELHDFFMNFHTHYSTHTGEYAFQCHSCKLKKPFRADIQSHQLHSKQCRNARVENVYLYPPNLKVIYLYYCKICNFTQLNEANVFKHLRDHHGCRIDDPSKVDKSVLAKIIAPESCEYNASASRNPCGIEVAALAQLAEDEGITVSNEPICDETLVDVRSAIKEELLLGNECAEPPPHHSPACSTFVPTSSAVINTTPSNAEAMQMPLVHKPMPLPVDEDIKPDIKELEAQIAQKPKKNVNATAEVTSKPLRNNTSHESFRVCPPDIPYFGLFKCMVETCVFSSDIDDEMLQHLNDHILNGVCGGLFNCAYCKLDVDKCTSPEMLVSHIRQRHGRNRFQCPKCCYRSCLPGNTAIHRQQAHQGEDVGDVIYECKGREMAATNRLAQMKKCMSENVKKISCPDCNVGFYARNNLIQHRSEVHNVENGHIDAFPRYACIYCPANSQNKKDMQGHLAICHPDEFPYACERILKPDVKVDSLLKLELVNIALAILPKSILKAEYAKFPPSIASPSTSSTSVNFTEPIQPVTRTIIPEPVEATLVSSVSKMEVDSCLVAEENSSSVNDAVQDMKPDYQRLVDISVENVKPLLLRLTQKTGIPPDSLYRCPLQDCKALFHNFKNWKRHMCHRHNCLIASCPHCPALEVEITDFEEHFEQHCRHMYLCFHCSDNFVNEQQIRAHFAGSHAQINTLRIEAISLGINHTYHVVADDSIQTDRLHFLMNLSDVLRKRVQRLEEFEAESMKTEWLVTSSPTWMDVIPYFSMSNRPKKCLMNNCSFRPQQEEDFFAHLRECHFPGQGSEFKCYRCPFTIKSNIWDPIIDHIIMHRSDIYFCCICTSYHYNRRRLSQHIRENHNMRDVPIVLLKRSESSKTTISICIVFAKQRHTITTLHSCFCCNESDFNATTRTFKQHLQKAHSLNLRYFCEYCDTPLPRLHESDDHFLQEHKAQELKIYCLVASNSPLCVDDVKPLRVLLGNNSGVDKSTSDFNAVQGASTSCKSIIKQEMSDEDVMLIEDDDVVIEKELKACGTKQPTPETGLPRIQCINVNSLLTAQRSSNAPQYTAINSTSQPLVMPAREAIHISPTRLTAQGTPQAKTVLIKLLTAPESSQSRVVPNETSQNQPATTGYPIPVLDSSYHSQQSDPEMDPPRVRVAPHFANPLEGFPARPFCNAYGIAQQAPFQQQQQAPTQAPVHYIRIDNSTQPPVTVSYEARPPVPQYPRIQ